MSVFNQAMSDPVIKKLILIEFGFGEVSPVKVEKWIKKHYPHKYAEYKRDLRTQKVLPFKQEMMSKTQRSALLDKEEIYRDFYK